MQPDLANEVNEFINNRMAESNAEKVGLLQRLNLSVLLEKQNLYLMRAKTDWLAGTLIKDALENYLFPFEEDYFNQFLAELDSLLATIMPAVSRSDIKVIEAVSYWNTQNQWKFLDQKRRVIGKFTKELMFNFCDDSGIINWQKLVEFNSGNLDLSDTHP